MVASLNWSIWMWILLIKSSLSEAEMSKWSVFSSVLVSEAKDVVVSFRSYWNCRSSTLSMWCYLYICHLVGFNTFIAPKWFWSENLIFSKNKSLKKFLMDELHYLLAIVERSKQDRPTQGFVIEGQRLVLCLLASTFLKKNKTCKIVCLQTYLGVGMINLTRRTLGQHRQTPIGTWTSDIAMFVTILHSKKWPGRLLAENLLTPLGHWRLEGSPWTLAKRRRLRPTNMVRARGLRGD